MVSEAQCAAAGSSLLLTPEEDQRNGMFGRISSCVASLE
jgi:hypothetical protein